MQHGIVVAGVQKNLGPAGLTIGLVRKDLIGHADALCPSILSYKEQAANGSIYNTPPVFSIYMTKLVMAWIKRQGGVTVMDDRNKAKSKLIYDIIDDSDGFYRFLAPLPRDWDRMGRDGSGIGAPWTPTAAAA